MSVTKSHSSTCRFIFPQWAHSLYGQCTVDCVTDRQTQTDCAVWMVSARFGDSKFHTFYYINLHNMFLTSEFKAYKHFIHTLTWFFNYLLITFYIVKAVLDYKILYILLMNENTTRMPHLKMTVSFLYWEYRAFRIDQPINPTLHALEFMHK